jgi:hypothetical protein
MDDIEIAAAILSILHDGTVVSCRQIGTNVELTIEIEYLARRLTPSCDGFVIVLHDLTRATFHPWPNEPNTEPKVLDGLRVFSEEIQILSASAKEGGLEMICNQPATAAAYSGGEMFVELSRVSVTSLAGQALTFEMLESVCTEYWAEWKAAGESRRTN